MLAAFDSLEYRTARRHARRQKRARLRARRFRQQNNSVAENLTVQLNS
jgi:hypothetical protein